MTDSEKNELSGRLFALELISSILLKDYIDHRLADTGSDTEHLDAFVDDLQSSFETAIPNKSSPAYHAGKTVIFRLLGASLQKYWK